DDTDVATEEETEDEATEEEAVTGDDDDDAAAGEEIRIAAGEAIVIGVSTPLTGPDANLGIDSRDGAIVGVAQWQADNEEQILGHDIDVVAEDDGCSDAAIATTAAERLLDIPNLVGIAGPTCSGGTQAVIPLYQENSVVMISGSATRSDLTLEQPEPRFFFRTAFRNSAEGVLQASYAIDELGATTAYVIDDTEPYGEDLANAAQDALEEGGVTVTREKINRGDTDFSALASRIADDNPDVAIFEGFNPEGQLIAAALNSAGYGGGFISDDGVASVNDFITPDPDVAEGAVFAGCAGELPDDYLTFFEETIGQVPTTPFAGQYSDAAYILLIAINEVAEDDGGELVIDTAALRDAVENASHDGITGSIAFDENGDRVGETPEELGLVLCSVQGGEFVIIE
ncbi:MAG: ABC transporter substrate-binding protein, partial [Dehalococcoidia bacterium]|nr:ABC transporter substrate-binding protein [Dehalococcoidia bacterium]